MLRTQLLERLLREKSGQLDLLSQIHPPPFTKLVFSKAVSWQISSHWFKWFFDGFYAGAKTTKPANAFALAS
jgi:hypothetical protein